MKLVDFDDVVGSSQFAIGAGIFNIPGELLGGYLDGERVFRDLSFDEPIGFLAGKSQIDHDQSRNRRPDDFKTIIAVIVNGFDPLLLAVTNEKIDQKPLNGEENGSGNIEDQVKNPIHSAGVTGGRIRQPPCFASLVGVD